MNTEKPLPRAGAFFIFLSPVLSPLRRSKIGQCARKCYTHLDGPFLPDLLYAFYSGLDLARNLLNPKDMAYLPRYEIIYDGAYFHVTWQCHNKEWLLQWEWAKRTYYNLLLKYKDKYAVEFYSYNFMDNHPHLTGHLETKERFSAFFRVVNSQFARIVNKHLKRRGQVVMDRFKSPVIESDQHMLTVMAYGDLNQHRAKKVTHPRNNDWSSYQYYAYGKADPLITPSPSYLALGRDPPTRQREYHAIVEALMRHRRTMNISHTHFIGNPDWVLKKYRELCERLGRKVTDAMVIRLTSPPT